jgi:periplasmic copper chaperone A
VRRARISTARLVALLCFAHSTNASAAAAISVQDAWARATPPGSTVGVVYALIVAEQSDELVCASTDAAERAEIHVSMSEGGTMKMRPMTSVALPANKPVQLQPGGLHMMLIGLHEPLQAGTSFTLTLRFRSSQPLTVPVKVIGPGAMK